MFNELKQNILPRPTSILLESSCEQSPIKSVFHEIIGSLRIKDEVKMTKMTIKINFLVKDIIRLSLSELFENEKSKKKVSN